ncbi:START/RHO_alpha_C/PITP/Bet_v1/CoxG/CalC (SRPBCC)ligand-binding domain superfamily protein [Halanaeroarchaeum sp. HSR-CO]|uniref:SRPBCC family protein n=1 Tax=Halanaeroarchaeum sp. HSR-CO TaxID=2866382 RepID=UPI00217D12AC|nr:SRPBCC family protein [Halanaeroarchaeum sp. HSR-CO]UWG48549.1 START/RHO_alpha_C/PITP/Bet_v1/CoxG/CalC (SRPBCC)ligand-binding domain superfamily protein [Halanaeroarchaeum sp. HSR-CO]
MARVRESRTFAVPPAELSGLIERDLESFVGASGVDSVSMTGDRIALASRLGLASIELVVRIDREADAVLAFDAVDGMFERMRTEYTVEATDPGSRLVAWTEFTLGGVIGTALDETLVSMQRNREFEYQFDYLETLLDAEAVGP